MLPPGEPELEPPLLKWPEVADQRLDGLLRQARREVACILVFPRVEPGECEIVRLPLRFLRLLTVLLFLEGALEKSHHGGLARPPVTQERDRERRALFRVIEHAGKGFDQVLPSQQVIQRGNITYGHGATHDFIGLGFGIGFGIGFRSGLGPGGGAPAGPHGDLLNIRKLRRVKARKD